jgi:AcrR family transcriptional regulator
MLPSMPASEIRPPRRLSKAARLDQLVAAAMPVVAEQGLAEFSLEEVAGRAGVTRNLLYHYFPRGRPDVVVAVVHRAGAELSADWIVDESLPLSERLAANFRRMGDHAFGPSDAWRIHRRVRAADDPELSGIASAYIEKVISSVSVNHLGTPDPPPLVHLALNGFVAFAETAADEARNAGIARETVNQLLSETLVATIAAARRASATDRGE